MVDFKMEWPSESDFPPGTIFVVKKGYPYASIPNLETGRREVYAFGTGKKCGPSPSVDLAGSNWPVSMAFSQWLAAVKQAAEDFAKLVVS
jgi:hypothetical protein